ncbi:MAG: HEPN domain-containing protein [Nitrospinota bacterium]
MSREAVELWNRALQAVNTAKLNLTTDSDTAASRANYAAFYATSALFALRGQFFSKHSALEVAIHRDLVKTGEWPKKLGSDYSVLRQLRFTADYGGWDHVSEAEASGAIDAAYRIIHVINKAQPDFFMLSSDT